MDTNLNDMVKHIVNSDDEAAAQAFHGFVKEKMRVMVAARRSQADQAEQDPDKKE